MREVRMEVKAIELVVTIALKHSKCQLNLEPTLLTLTDSPSLPHSLSPTHTHPRSLTSSHSHTPSFSHTLSRSLALTLGSQNKP